MINFLLLRFSYLLSSFCFVFHQPVCLVRKLVRCISLLGAVVLLSQGLCCAGQLRVWHVMYKGVGGIDDINRSILFADTKNIAADLNLYEIAARFECKTLFGKAFLEYSFERVISPHDISCTIQHRQQIIKFFIDHPELQEKFDRLLQQAVVYEAEFIQFMNNRYVIDDSVANIKNFGDAYTLFLNLKRKYTLGQIFDQATNLLSVQDSLGKCLVQVDSVYKEGVYNTLRNMRYVPEYNQTTKSLLAGFLLSWGVLCAQGVFTWDTLAAWAAISATGPLLLDLNTVFSGVVSMGVSSWGLYSYYIQALAIRDSLYALHQLGAIVKEIDALCDEHGIEHQFSLKSIVSHDGRALIEGVQHERYSEKTSKFILTPVIHSFVYQVYEHDVHLAPIYAAIGEIDAYIAIAKKMTELQQAPHKFCFAEFIDSDQPTIDAQDFWNVLVSKGSIVVNSLSEHRNIILTGANEGGKTTAIRAILQNIMLAQTFGIAAASKFRFTPFDIIYSHLHIADDILQGKSRFASELQEAQRILQRIKRMAGNEKFFFTLDELFTGTNGEDGAECAYKFMTNLSSYQRIQFIYATHFNMLKEIDTLHPSCANYKVDSPFMDEHGYFIRTQQGDLIYPYTVSPGSNHVNVALVRAEDTGIFS